MIVTLAKRLRILRRQKGLTQQALCNELGLNRSTYAKYETGENHPEVETLVRLADYFGVSVDYLLGRSSSPDGRQDVDLPNEQLEFVRFIASHIDEAFFEEFDGSEEEMKEALMENLMFGWEQIKKYMERRRKGRGES
ncbi:helix-turn-helix domain-containing protein [Alicyclobacillus sendaiensis]|uniref:helix-turn-helix domain-containing protein n=1 Tax=Alicyclobacillus sendaiensis TaxID=192387 RepID=UPI0026F410AD|nr:helix-turn-helix domain-containing protein [Alicyclobacillus sendaiensis]